MNKNVSEKERAAKLKSFRLRDSDTVRVLACFNVYVTIPDQL